MKRLASTALVVGLSLCGATHAFPIPTTQQLNSVSPIICPRSLAAEYMKTSVTLFYYPLLALMKTETKRVEIFI